MGLSVFPILAVLSSMFLLLINYNEVIYLLNKHGKKVIYFLLFFIIHSLFVALFNSEYLYPKRVLFLITIIPVCIYSAYLLINKKEQLLEILKLVLTIHLFFMFFQLCFYLVTGEFIDFLESLTGEQQRALGGSYYIDSLGGLRLARVTGLYVEPGTYSTFTMVLYAFYKSLEVDLYRDISKINWFDIAILSSCVLTFSTYGFIFVGIFMIFSFFKLNYKGKVVLLLSSIPVIYFVVVNYLLIRFSVSHLDSSGVGFREQGVTIFMDYLQNSPFNLLLGSSYLVNFSHLVGVYDRFPFNDVGFAFNFIVHLGILGSLFVLSMVLPLKKNKWILVIIILLSKLDITTMLLWFVFPYIFVDNSDELCEE